MSNSKVVSAALVSALAQASIIDDWKDLSESTAEITVKIPARLVEIIVKFYGVEGFDKMIEEGFRHILFKTSENIFKQEFKDVNELLFYIKRMEKALEVMKNDGIIET